MKMKEGSQEAFMDLYNHFYQSLYVFGCRIQQDPQLVKDNIHEVFCEVWADRDRLPAVQQPLSYLFTYLKRKMLRDIKISALPVDDALLSANAVEQSYEELLILSEGDAEMKYKLRHFTRQLSATQQAILQLKYYENLKYEEIARRLSLQPRTVYNKLHEALKMMRKSLRMAAFPLIFLLF
jgi:RNA polymerase sigma factor (sigma-70 family)